jgi:hypothetical protein
MNLLVAGAAMFILKPMRRRQMAQP